MNRRAMCIPPKTAGPTFLPALALPALALPALALLALAGCHAGGGAGSTERPPLAGAAIGGPFTLEDKTGRPVHWSDFAGAYRIVYFGYTFCPDACPTDLSMMARGLALFTARHPALGAAIRPMFITIDPARDTPRAMGEYAAAISPRLLGLTGTPAQVDAAARAFAVYYAKGRTEHGGYLMEHSRITYLMGRDGAPLAMLPTDQNAQAVATELARWVK